jgi:hypothetical protein
MKAWRKNAEKINAEVGEKHRGRISRAPQFIYPKYLGASHLLALLFGGADLLKPIEEKKDEPASPA